MDIEELSKTQLLLLMILVCFVVSIGTGVLTVSLLNQAPTTITQTVNRIIDHTIETVKTQVPVISGTPEPTPSTEDLLTEAIAANASRVVTIKRNENGEVIARGFLIVGSRSIVTVSNTQLPARVYASFADGTGAEIDRSKVDGTVLVYALKADTKIPDVKAMRLLSDAELKQGQTLIALTADGSVATGIISKIDTAGIHTDLPIVPAGSLAVTISGNIAGVSSGTDVLIPASRIDALISVTPAP